MNREERAREQLNTTILAMGLLTWLIRPPRIRALPMREQQEWLRKIVFDAMKLRGK